MNKKIILYGAGVCGMEALHFYGRGNIAFFCDTFKRGYKSDIEIISFDRLKEIYEEYRVIITIELREIQNVVARQLRENQIPYEVYDMDRTLIHVKGKYPDIEFETQMLYPTFFQRALGTVLMLRKALESNQSYFANRDLDIYIFVGDEPQTAYEIMKILGREKILAYNTCYPYQNEVISIPDYKFVNNEFVNQNIHITETFKNITELGKRSSYKYEQAFWAGNIYNHVSRRTLSAIADMNPQLIKCNTYIWRGELVYGKSVPPIDFLEYKYLIDIRGAGWTDRIKYLLAMGRPLLLIDRPFQEYYFDKLEAMKHYVPVKEDMSDLIEKIELLNSNKELYELIVKNATQFVLENFTTEKVISELFHKLKMVCD